MQAGCDAMTCGYIAQSKPCGNSSSINLPSNHSTQSSLTCIILQAYSNVNLTDNNLLYYYKLILLIRNLTFTLLIIIPEGAKLVIITQ